MVGGAQSPVIASEQNPALACSAATVSAIDGARTLFKGAQYPYRGGERESELESAEKDAAIDAGKGGASSARRRHRLKIATFEVEDD